MQDNVIVMPAPTVRQAGYLEKALAGIPASRWANRRGELATAYNRCPRVRMILSRNADKFGVDLDDLKQDVWMVFQEKMLPILDSPSNVYSVLYRCSELCSRSLINGVRETTLSVGEDEEVEEVMHRLLEANGPSGATMDEQIEVELDTQKARQAVQQKLAQFGWPAGIPREESAYRRAGRPLKVTTPVELGNNGTDMTKNTSLLFGTVMTVDEGDPKAAKAFLASRVRQTQPPQLTAPVQTLLELRQKMQVPVDRFGELIDARPDTVRALFYGTHVNDKLTNGLIKKARVALADMRKNPDMLFMMKSDMAKIIKRWRLLLEEADDVSTIKAIVAQTDRKFATLYRWYVDNRKPVNIFDLYDIDTMVRLIALKKSGKKKDTGTVAELKGTAAANTPVAKKAATAKKVVGKPVAKKAATAKKAVVKPAAKKAAAEKVPAKPAAKKAAPKTAARSKK